jgi:hypothetical protein
MCMRNAKTRPIPAIIGATGIISITQKIPEQHTEKAWNHGTRENSHTGHCTHTSEVQTFNLGNNITCATNSEYRIGATLYTLETWFVSVIEL